MSETVSIIETLLNINGTLSNETIPDNGFRSREASRWIPLIGLPTLVVIGTTGNLMSFFVMRRGSLKSVSTCLYMAILALGDTGVLWAGAFVEWIRYLTDYTLDLFVIADCKIGPFLFFFFSHYSSFILSAMSVEKFFALYFPLRTKSICTVKTAKRVLVVLAVIFIAFDLQSSFILRANVFPDGSVYCVFDSDSHQAVYLRMDSILYSFVPFAIMIVANLAIIYKFMMAKLGSRNQNNTQSTSQALSKSAVKGTTMLITVSVTFIILTGPVAIIYTITTTPTVLQQALLVFIQYSNHSINGVLYCIVGSRFRNELKQMLCCISKPSRRTKQNRTTSVSDNSKTFTSVVSTITDGNVEARPSSPT